MAERDVPRGHSHEADGIEEYDNPLPGWWLGIFYVTIGFSVVYTVDYHFVSPRAQAAEYDAEMADAEAKWPKKVAAAAPTDPTAAAGKAIYDANCVGCHGVDLHGGVGPNLTDTTWIHGGSIDNITRVITEGVPEKGMITWGPILGPEKVAQVAAFVHGSGGGQ